MKSRFMATVLPVICLVFVVSILFPAVSVEAAFSKNKLISDTVMNQKGSMSASQINSFLNKFSNSCISTNSGFSAKQPTGYNPTDGFKYGSYVSAGKVIYEAAQAYDLNPRVLLVTLQKEQGLVRGDGPYGCGKTAMASAMGYGCPDSGGRYNYSGISLYKRNGTVYTSISGTCVNSKSKAGFTQQTIRAAWLLKFGQQRSLGNTDWAIIRGSWNNSDDPDTYYSGPMTRGSLKRCSSCSTVFYDGYKTIDGQSVYMSTGGTAALYWYTPHIHGNQLFVSIYEGWFGSTTYTEYPQTIAGDFNGDGEYDIGTRSLSSGDVAIKYRNGSGFGSQTTYKWAGGKHFHTFAGDFNGDGDADLGLRRLSDGTIYIRYGNGNGSFNSQTTYKWAGGSHFQTFAGDFDGDSDWDIALRRKTNGLIYIQYGNGSGSFGSQSKHSWPFFF